ncbi:ethanolamine ammonia-lyase subunit EutC [Arundinibacter roseus]|uniref:Ethanolamine ammonia-lyase small subunit n=1 Tax=Arundinibacter roseus TaxID=2070510 RepID=A0A4R4KB69_9BACT|nr:ethanolamine ammonia-lyase subunit EutC [Arundinibacter roseus]TDB63982.1 ethanolamine ammonia-lyase subunit EutC [Arundinibacter roseus]
MTQLTQPDDWEYLRQFTPARLALGRSGHSIPTRQLLEFNLDHARARDAVYSIFDQEWIKYQVSTLGLSALFLQSQARDRREFLLRPDLGRRLNEPSRQHLKEQVMPPNELSIVVADGLSASAVNAHAPQIIGLLVPQMKALGWQMAPVGVVSQARVAVADEIGFYQQSEMVLILIGERPGLTSPDSMGAYLTYRPKPGLTDESRNCISNIRPDGLSYERATEKIVYLLTEMKKNQLSGVGLKDDFNSQLNA